MDIWKYYWVTHRDHLVMNPRSEAKTDEFLSLLALAPSARVLDVASGKDEQLLRIAERYGASGTGVDISPFEVEGAIRRAISRNQQDRITVVEGDGTEFNVGRGKTPSYRGLNSAP
jgi:cyclopropane fatty-acyl-phospholipid synthase-like methyltransferase